MLFQRLILTQDNPFSLILSEYSRTHVFRMNFLVLITIIPSHQPFKINLFPNRLQVHSLTAGYVEDLTNARNQLRFDLDINGLPASRRAVKGPQHTTFS